MIKKTVAVVVLLLLSFSIFAQSDALWQKAVNVWELSKNDEAGYCVKSMTVGAKGFSSDYNTGGSIIEGGMLYQDDGFFRINTVRFVNKGDEYILDEAKATKDSFPDMLHIKENLVFSKDNQGYLKINKIDDNNDAIAQYKVIANIPDFSEFEVIVSIDAKTGNPIKVVNEKYASSATTAAGSKILVTYIEVNGKVVVNELLEEAKVNFFGNASYITDSYVFSKY